MFPENVREHPLKTTAAKSPGMRLKDLSLSTLYLTTRTAIQQGRTSRGVKGLEPAVSGGEWASISAHTGLHKDSRQTRSQSLKPRHSSKVSHTLLAGCSWASGGESDAHVHVRIYCTNDCRDETAPVFPPFLPVEGLAPTRQANNAPHRWPCQSSMSPRGWWQWSEWSHHLAAPAVPGQPSPCSPAASPKAGPDLAASHPAQLNKLLKPPPLWSRRHCHSWCVFFFFPALVRYKSHGGSLFTNLYPTLCNPMDYSLPGSSVHGTLQARILEWVAITGEDPFPGDLPDPGIKPASLQANSLPTEPPGSSVIDIFPILKSFLVGTPKFYSLSKFQLCHTVLSASPHHTLRSSDLIPLTADSLNPFTHLSLFPPAPPSSPDNHHSTHWF